MSEIHQLTESEESAQEFLARLSGQGGAARPAGKPGAHRRKAGSATQPRPVSLQDILQPAARPWVPASASLGIWGGGQWLNGQRSLAVLFVVLELLTASIVYCLTMSWRSWVSFASLFFVTESQIQVAAFWAGALVPVLTIAAVLQAYTYACRRRRLLPFGGPTPIPMVASALVPGWGQMLNAEGGKAAVFLVVWLSGLYTLGVSWFRPEFWSSFDPTPHLLVGYDFTAVQIGAMAAVVLACVVSLYDALLAARRLRDA